MAEREEEKWLADLREARGTEETDGWMDDCPADFGWHKINLTGSKLSCTVPPFPGDLDYLRSWYYLSNPSAYGWGRGRRRVGKRAERGGAEHPLQYLLRLLQYRADFTYSPSTTLFFYFSPFQAFG